MKSLIFQNPYEFFPFFYVFDFFFNKLTKCYEFWIILDLTNGFMLVASIFVYYYTIIFFINFVMTFRHFYSAKSMFSKCQICPGNREFHSIKNFSTSRYDKNLKENHSYSKFRNNFICIIIAPEKN